MGLLLHEAASTTALSSLSRRITVVFHRQLKERRVLLLTIYSPRRRACWRIALIQTGIGTGQRHSDSVALSQQNRRGVQRESNSCQLAGDQGLGIFSQETVHRPQWFIGKVLRVNLLPIDHSKDALIHIRDPSLRRHILQIGMNSSVARS